MVALVPRDTDRHGNTKRETHPPIRMEREYIAGVNHHEMVRLTAARYIEV